MDGSDQRCPCWGGGQQGKGLLQQPPPRIQPPPSSSNCWAMLARSPSAPRKLPVCSVSPPPSLPPETHAEAGPDHAASASASASGCRLFSYLNGDWSAAPKCPVEFLARPRQASEDGAGGSEKQEDDNGRS